MQKNKRDFDFEWYDWQSEASDLEAIDPKIRARILFYILLVSEFEHAVLRLTNDECVYGPAHTSHGQEAAAAATMAALRKTDKVVTTYRAHHHFLSKSLQYILPESWDPLADELPDDGHEVVYRTMAEIMGLADGYCAGRGGSMHLRFPDAGFLGSNAIVAGGVPLATGAAFRDKFNKTGNVTVCFFGDGAMNQGILHESCNFAGLWNLPLICCIENNFYAVGTHVRDACAIADLSLRASSYGMDAHIVYGTDVPAIYHAVTDAADRIRAGGPPCMIEIRLYRRYHHAGDKLGSAFGYRTREEEEEWLAKEAVSEFPKALIEAELLTDADIERVREITKTAVAGVVDRLTIAGDPRKVRPELWPPAESATDGLRSDGHEFDTITFSEREDFADFKNMRYSDAIAAVTGNWLEQDDQVVVLGEEIANFGGGAYGATKGLPQKYPDRVINTPISEAGFAGLGFGAAMTGMRMVIEIMFPDFALVAADQIFNQIGKARYMYGDTTNLPLVIRSYTAMGRGYGGQHSMDPVGLYALFPGWRIVAPANSFDYVGLFNTAMQSLDPVVILEHHSLYTTPFPVPVGELDYYIPFGTARVLNEGDDVTVLTYAALATRCEKLIAEFEAAGVSAELIDLRTLDPPSIDYETIGESLRKTGAVAIVEEAATGQSIGSRIAGELMERYFDYLDVPVARLSSLDVPLPVSKVLEAAAMIADDRILDTVTAVAKRKWK